MNAKVAPKNLPCLFESLTNEYDESQLTRCETKEGQKWRRATANAAAKRITEMANTKYFPELSALLDSLENYSLCERHYNQIVVSNYYIKRVMKPDDSNFEDSLVIVSCHLPKKLFLNSESKYPCQIQHTKCF